MGWSVTGRRLGGAPVEFGGVTDAPPAAPTTPDGPLRMAPAPPPTAPRHPKPTRLVLVRHAVTAQTGPMLSGRMPGIDLSDTGMQQAEALGERLAKLPISIVYASPIERTTQTAAAIAAHHGLEVQPCPGVIEADYGEWTGGKIADLAKTDQWKTVQVAPSRARFPNGESITEMQARMVAALEEVVAAPPGRDWSSSCRTPTRSSRRSRTTPACTSTCSSASSCRRRRSPCSSFGTHGVVMVKCNDTGWPRRTAPAGARRPTKPTRCTRPRARTEAVS